MKCRRIYEDGNHYSLVYFNSDGLDFPYKLVVKLNNYTGNVVTSSYTTSEEIDLSIIPFDEIRQIRMVYDELKEVSPRKINFNVLIYKDKEDYSKSYIKFVFASKIEKNIVLENGYLYIKPIKLIDEQSEEEVDNKILLNANYTEDSELIMNYTFTQFAIAKQQYWIEENSASYNYAERQEGCACSLTQRMSILKGELWWMINYGIPLFDKIRNKSIFDSVLINIILKHPDVKNIISINSNVVNHVYTFEVQINTIFNETITISNDLMAV